MLIYTDYRLDNIMPVVIYRWSYILYYISKKKSLNNIERDVSYKITNEIIRKLLIIMTLSTYVLVKTTYWGEFLTP